MQQWCGFCDWPPLLWRHQPLSTLTSRSTYVLYKGFGVVSRFGPRTKFATFESVLFAHRHYQNVCSCTSPPLRHTHTVYVVDPTHAKIIPLGMCLQGQNVMYSLRLQHNISLSVRMFQGFTTVIQYRPTCIILLPNTCLLLQTKHTKFAFFLNSLMLTLEDLFFW